MNESETYKELVALTKNKERWEESIPFVASLLTSNSVKIQAKTLWMLGEMGLAFPDAVGNCMPEIVSFLNNDEPLLRERAVNALGRKDGAVSSRLRRIGRPSSTSLKMKRRA